MQPHSHLLRLQTLHAAEYLPHHPPEAPSAPSWPWLAHAARQHLRSKSSWYSALGGWPFTAVLRPSMPYNTHHAIWHPLGSQAEHGDHCLCLLPPHACTARQ